MSGNQRVKARLSAGFFASQAVFGVGVFAPSERTASFAHWGGLDTAVYDEYYVYYIK